MNLTERVIGAAVVLALTGLGGLNYYSGAKLSTQIEELKKTPSVADPAAAPAVSADALKTATDTLKAATDALKAAAAEPKAPAVASKEDDWKNVLVRLFSGKGGGRTLEERLKEAGEDHAFKETEIRSENRLSEEKLKNPVTKEANRRISVRRGIMESNLLAAFNTAMKCADEKLEKGRYTIKEYNEEMAKLNKWLETERSKYQEGLRKFKNQLIIENERGVDSGKLD